MNEEQRQALLELESGQNIFLTGRAGTGKTYVIKTFIERHQTETIVCAPTGLAANLIGGATLHRTFNIASTPCPRAGKKHCRSLEGCRTLIIDEISMVRADYFSYVAQIIFNMQKKLGRNIQIIVCGDFAQLPPVVTSKDLAILKEYYGEDIGHAYAFQSPEWKQLGFKTVLLTAVVRQKDSEYLDMLNKIRIGDLATAYEMAEKSVQHTFDPTRVTICTTNDRVSSINAAKLREIQEPAKTFTMSVTGNVNGDDIVCEKALILKKGCRVMLTANLAPHRVNGSLGWVMGISRNAFTGMDEVKVKWDKGGMSVITQYTWNIYEYKTVGTGNSKKIEKLVRGTVTQLPLKVAYAVTVHRCQGQTFEAANLVLDTVFVSGQLYTACTRVSSFDGLYIAPGMAIRAMADPVVISFYNSLNAAPLCNLHEDGTKRTETRGRKQKYGEPTTTIRVPKRLVARIKLEVIKILEEENGGGGNVLYK